MAARWFSGAGAILGVLGAVAAGAEFPGFSGIFRDFQGAVFGAILGVLGISRGRRGLRGSDAGFVRNPAFCSGARGKSRRIPGVSQNYTEKYISKFPRPRNSRGKILDFAAPRRPKNPRPETPAVVPANAIVPARGQNLFFVTPETHVAQSRASENNYQMKQEFKMYYNILKNNKINIK